MKVILAIEVRRYYRQTFLITLIQAHHELSS